MSNAADRHERERGEREGDREAKMDATDHAVRGDGNAAERRREGNRDPPQDRLDGEPDRAPLLRSASPTTAKSVGLAMLDHAITNASPAKTNAQ
jgi:hypothetical protein